MLDLIKLLFILPKKIPTSAVLAACIVFALFKNYFTPICGTDISHSFIWNGENGGNILFGAGIQPISSLADIFVSQCSYYATWSGRLVANFFTEFFLWIGKPAFNFANTFIFYVLLTEIFYISIKPLRSNRLSRWRLIYIFLALWICAPSFAATMFNLSGACNYLWMSVLQILFIFPYVSELAETLPAPKPSQKNSSKPVKIFFMIVVGFLAGLSNETGAIAVIFLAAFFIVATKIRGVLKLWQLAGLAALIAGFVIMFFAPGNFVRTNLVFSGQFQYGAEIFTTHLSGIFEKNFLREAVLFFPIIYLFGALISEGKLRKTFSEVYLQIVTAFTLASLLSLGLILFSPHFSERAGFSSTIFLIIASLCAVNLIIKEKLLQSPTLKKFVQTVGIFTMILGISTAAWGVSIDWSLLKQMRNQRHIINRHKNDELIVVPKIHSPSRYGEILADRTVIYYFTNLDWEITEDPKNFRNVEFARYHGVKNIVQSDNLSGIK